jgi:hypothetical protein
MKMASEKQADPEADAAPPSQRAGLVDGDGAPTEAEYSVSTAKKFAYLAFYFTANVSLTIYNKLVLGKVCMPVCLYCRRAIDRVS